ncbi:expressed conserved protein [Echinococcus multilocularis]|uniref:Expressed conserved protein n=1 Tax=Echinococcus multilocularis TaxID=6211 RepID=A0A068XZL9_ECHMU|nr:expressed conserved protein [Echinococcus multilocularis]
MHSKSKSLLLMSSLLLAALHVNNTAFADAKMASDFIAERMLDVADSEGLADAVLPLVRCYDLLEELRTECNQRCRDNAPNVNACLRSCWGGWKYGRLTCRLRYS